MNLPEPWRSCEQGPQAQLRDASEVAPGKEGHFLVHPELSSPLPRGTKGPVVASNGECPPVPDWD